MLLLSYYSVQSGQSWVPKYSIRGELDSPIHGYSNYNANNPWEIAEDLMNPDNYISGNMGMEISSYTDKYNASGVYTGTAISTTGGIFYLNKNNPNSHIQAYIRSDVNNYRDENGFLASKYLFSLQFLKENDVPLSTFDPTINRLCNTSAGDDRYYFNESGSIEFRLNGDGLMMIRINSDSIKAIKLTLHFYPGYEESSLKIPQFGSSTIYNKEDVNHVFMDEYGGFGVYLLDSELKDLSNVGSNPVVRFPVPQAKSYSSSNQNKIFWIASFPPKKFDYNNSMAFKQIVQTNWYSNARLIPPDSKRVEDYNIWNEQHNDPMSTYWMVSNDSKRVHLNDLEEYITNTNPNLIGGTFIHFGALDLWKNWQYEYIPKKNFSVSDEFSLLKLISSNVRNSNMKYIVYTSPQSFLKNATNYVAQLPGEDHNNPYKKYISDLDQLDDINSVAYTIMNTSTIRDKFTLVKQDPRLASNRIPILANENMMYYYNGTNNSLKSDVDHFMLYCGFPRETFVHTNREGENMFDFIDAITNLRNNMGSSALNGIYMDTFYELNIPRTYQLMRELKTRFGDDFILYRHASSKEGQDAYLPQIDSYADYVLTGEGNNKNDYFNRKFFRFFISTINISNSIAVLYDPKNIDKNDNNFFDMCNVLNVRLCYPTIQNNNGDPNRDDRIELVTNFWNNFPANGAQLLNGVENNLSVNQPMHKQNYLAMNNIFYELDSDFSSNVTDYIFHGDVNKDFTDEAIVYNSGNWFCYSLNQNISVNHSVPNNIFETIDATTGNPYPGTPYVGDFNGDGKTDFGIVSASGDNRNFLSHSTFEEFLYIDDFGHRDLDPITNIPINTWWNGLYDFPVGYDHLLVGDFNGDNCDDLLFVKNSVWSVYLSDKCTGFIYNGEFSENSWGCSTGSVWGVNSDIPIVGDFNGDDIDDVGIFRTNSQSGEWYISLSDGVHFNETTPQWFKHWGNTVADFPLIGNFDSGNRTDIMIHRLDYNSPHNWFINLSNWDSFITGSTSQQTFVEPNPYWGISLGYREGTDRPVILDFNGDGYDDIGFYRINADDDEPKFFVRYIKPGEVKSVEAGNLPKEGEIVLTDYSLEQNFPNPFNPSTKIRYSIPNQSKVVLSVYDILGQRVAELVNEVQETGTYTVNFSGENLSSGVYIYRLRCNDFTESKKFVLVK